MAEDDLETGRPREHARLPIGRSPLGFSQALTLFLSLMLLGALVCFTLPGTETVHMYTMERPIETTQRVLERNLWVDEAVDELPEWAQGATRSLLEVDVSPRELAIAAFEDVVEKNGYPRPDEAGEAARVDPRALDGLRARRAVLLAESGRIDEALGDLERLEAAGHGSFVAAVHTAYSALAPATPVAFSTFDLSLAGDEWIGVHLAQRLAERVGDDAETSRWNAVAAERRTTILERVRWLAAIDGALIAVGLVVLLVWLFRNRPDVRRASAEIPPAWTFEAGYAVCVRGAFGAILISFLLDQVAARTNVDELRVGVFAVLPLPLFWFVRRRLVAPFGSTYAATFGLRGLRGPWRWTAFTIALYALGRVGAHAITDVVRALGASSHWSEGIDAGVIWSPAPVAAFGIAVTCIMAPIAIELGFRGVFYATMRRHYTPVRAALLTAALFGATQVSSLPAFLSLLWLSFVLAIGYETSRSLLPGILCGALGALAAEMTTWLLLR